MLGRLRRFIAKANEPDEDVARRARLIAAGRAGLAVGLALSEAQCLAMAGQRLPPAQDGEADGELQRICVVCGAAFVVTVAELAKLAKRFDTAKWPRRCRPCRARRREGRDNDERRWCVR